MHYALDTFAFAIDDRLTPRTPLVLRRGEGEELRIGYSPAGETSPGEILEQEAGFQRAFARPGTLTSRRGSARIAHWPAETLESEFRGGDGAGFLGVATAQIWPDRRIEIRYVCRARNGDPFDFAAAGHAFEHWMSAIVPVREAGYAAGWVSVPRRPEWTARGWLRFESEDGTIVVVITPGGEGPGSWSELFDPGDGVMVKKTTLSTQEQGPLRIDLATSHLERAGREVLEDGVTATEVQADYLGLEATVWNGFEELMRLRARGARQAAAQLVEMWNRLLASVRAGGADVERGV